MDSTGRFLLGGALGAVLGYYVSHRGRQRAALQGAHGPAAQVAIDVAPGVEAEPQTLSPLMAAATQAPVAEPPVTDALPVTDELPTADALPVTEEPSLDDIAVEAPYAPLVEAIPEAPPLVWPAPIGEVEYAPAPAAEETVAEVAEAPGFEDEWLVPGAAPVMEAMPVVEAEPALEAEPAFEVEAPMVEAEPAVEAAPVAETVPGIETAPVAPPYFDWETKRPSEWADTEAIAEQAARDIAAHEEALASELVLEPPVLEGQVEEVAFVESAAEGVTEAQVEAEAPPMDGLEALYGREESLAEDSEWAWEPTSAAVAEAPVAEAPPAEAPPAEAPVETFDQYPVVVLPVVEPEAFTEPPAEMGVPGEAFAEEWPDAVWSVPVVEAPVAETPLAEEPAVEAPAAEEPALAEAADMPVSELPVVELPLEETEHELMEMPVDVHVEAPVMEAAEVASPVVEETASVTESADAAPAAAPMAALDDLKARIEETRRRIRQELDQPFISPAAPSPVEDDWTLSPVLPAEATTAELEPAPVAEAEALEFGSEPVDTSESEEEQVVDYDSMRSRIELTRSRLKAKAFDAMMTGEAALLGRDTDDAAQKRRVVPAVDAEVNETIESSLREQEE